MNVFAVDENPVLSANLCDKHVVKMPLETVQMLSAVAIKRNFAAPYKLTHKNHPCTLWVERSSANWNWLCTHGIELCNQYTLRYGKIHKCQSFIEDFQKMTSRIFGDSIDFNNHTKFEQCLPDKYKSVDAIIAYRSYYNNDKAKFAKWKNGNIPSWFIIQ